MTTSKTTDKKVTAIRPSISRAFEVALCVEVNQVCPNCGDPLFVSKRGKRYRNYEIAHIYPLHPTDEEFDLLKDETKLAKDPNHEDNLIPLCFLCHSIFDNPKTVEEYRDLVDKKLSLINKKKQIDIFSQFQIEKDITKIIESLIADGAQFDISTTLDAKRVDDKLGNSIAPLAKQKIKNDVISFYLFVRERFADLERNDPGKAMLIATQVRAFYQKQKISTSNAQEIFNNTVQWLSKKHPSAPNHAAEAIAAFYIQNCELFE